MKTCATSFCSLKFLKKINMNNIIIKQTLLVDRKICMKRWWQKLIDLDSSKSRSSIYWEQNKTLTISNHQHFKNSFKLGWLIKDQAILNEEFQKKHSEEYLQGMHRPTRKLSIWTLADSIQHQDEIWERVRKFQ